MKFTNGIVYKGLWDKGKKHGKGTLIDREGKETVGDWNKGKRIIMMKTKSDGDILKN